MNDTFKVARLNGVLIGAHWSVLPLAVLVALLLNFGLLPVYAPDTGQFGLVTASIITAIGFLLSILAHELGHAYIAINHGLGVHGVTLWILGGATRIDPPTTPRSDFRVAAAGPAVSILTGLFFAGLAVIMDTVVGIQVVFVTIWWLALVNISLGLFNLFPASPLDGGRLLAAYLWNQSGDRHHARIIAGRSGLIFGGALTLFGGFQLLSFRPNGFMMTAVGVFVLRSAVEEIRTAALARRIGTKTLGQLALRHPQSIPESVSLHRLVQEFSRYPTAAADCAYPVSRWGYDTIGYVIPHKAQRIADSQRATMLVADIMTPLAEVEVVNANTQLADVVDDWRRNDEVFVVHDSTGEQPIGTLTPRQTAPLLARPDFLGRAPNADEEVSRS